MSERELEPEPALATSVPLGEIDPARSRHMWRRSGVVLHGDLAVVGTWDGEVRAFDVGNVGGEAAVGGDDAPLTERWARRFGDSPVTLASFGGAGDDGVADDEAGGDGGGEDGAGDDGTGREGAGDGTAGAIAVGGRGDDGTIAVLDPADGSIRWSYDGAIDVGTPTRDSVFYWPYVVALAVDEADGRLYAAVRRYERAGDERIWHSVVLAFDADGDVRWRYEADASPISIDLAPDGDRLAIGYNRCLGDHQRGLVVLDAASGAVDWTWDPPADGDRRIGDVRFDASGDADDGTRTLAVTSHGDYCGYVFDADGGSGAGGSATPDGVAGEGTPLWRAELATEIEIEGQTCYAYPNHVYAHDGRVAFLTGNTYARESRETEGRHPDEHAAFGYDGDGERRWRADADGFVHDLAAAGSTVVLPIAQNFRVRDAETHSVRTVDLATGNASIAPAAGIVTSAATDGTRVAAIEEPIEYHDEERVRGSYALHVGPVANVRRRREV